MNSNVIFLNLPPIPHKIELTLKDLCYQIQFSESRLKKFNDFYSVESTQYEIAAQEYGIEVVPVIPDNILDEMKQLYSGIFKGGVYIGIGMAISMNGSPSVTPPHCDWRRRVAINYLLDLGGEDVITTFYRETRTTNDLSRSENRLYKEVNKLEEYCLPVKTWHAFDPQRFHSVQNITSRRCYVSLYPIYNFTFNDLVTDYPEICQLN